LTVRGYTDTISPVLILGKSTVGSLFNFLFYQPTFNLLIIFYGFFAGNLGLAIIFVAILSRLVSFPLTRAQIKSAEKGKQFQKKYEDIKKKYSKNKEKLNEELAKLQSQYLPGQLAGCLPMIILIILLIQVRLGIVNLVAKGWHAFNEIAYVESLQREEEAIFYKVEEELATGEHRLKISIKSDNGNFLEKEYSFEIVESINNRVEEIKNEEEQKSKEERMGALREEEERERAERNTDISLFNTQIEENRVRIPISKFLIFTTESTQKVLLTDKSPDFEIFIRPPSNHVILTEETRVFLDDVDVTDGSELSHGEVINLQFLGIDLSKVAADFSWSDAVIIPYIVLGLMVGVSQFASTQVLTGLRGISGKKKEDKRKQKGKKQKAKKKDEEPDFSEMMSMVNKQMIFFFPVLTVITSLGYWGGARIFPSGLSIFWTVQSLFVIIQQLLMNRKKVITWVNKRLGKEAEDSKRKREQRDEHKGKKGVKRDKVRKGKTTKRSKRGKK
jgi:membrane protein insertase Oxa1/YidC/SpoIIIJ